MKRIFLLLYCAVCIGSAVQAQDLYSIYKFSGKVEYKQALSDTPWQPVVKGTELRSIDSIRFADGASVQVMHNRTRKLYVSKKACEMNIYHFIKKVMEDDASRINDGMLTDMHDGSKKKIDVHQMKMLGATTRSIQSGDTLKRMAEMFAWIGAQACSGKQTPKQEGLTFRKKEAFGEWDFIYENNTGKNYFMNVLHVNKLTGNVSLCYVTTSKGNGTASCPIVPTGYCQCGLDIYFPASENDVYVMVATELEYDTQEMDIELARHPIDKAKNTNIDIKYLW